MQDVPSPHFIPKTRLQTALTVASTVRLATAAYEAAQGAQLWNEAARAATLSRRIRVRRALEALRCPRLLRVRALPRFHFSARRNLLIYIK